VVFSVGWAEIAIIIGQKQGRLLSPQDCSDEFRNNFIWLACSRACNE
jgi:hypothetical protein